MKDSRGRESITLRFVTSGFVVLLLKFALAGVQIPVIGEMPDMGAGEFGAAMAAILAIWLGREWTEKVAKK